jgi:hypothetical protein
LLFTTGAFECKFVFATVPCSSEAASVIVPGDSNCDSESDGKDYISGTDDES